MDKVLSPIFRVSFPNVFTPRGFEGQAPKYSVAMLFDKSEDLTALKNLARKAVEEKWPNAEKRPKGLRNPFRDGDVEKADITGYENVMFANATSKMKPGIVDQNVQPIIDEAEFYGGCYARATLVAYAYDKGGNRGVAFGLQNIQKIRDGEPFSGRTKAEDDFSSVEKSEIGNDPAAPSGAKPASDNMFA